MEFREIKALVLLMQEYGLTELEIDDKKKGKLRLVRAAANEPDAARVMPPVTATPTRHMRAPLTKNGSGGQPTLTENQRAVTSPMVGTFYRASSPDAQPFVQEGDTVRKGQPLCIIEAMKMMNEIEAEVAGRIVSILSENAQAVEYGQPLMVLEVG